METLIELTSGDTTCFISTHLDHTKNSTERINQCAEINKLYAKNNSPSILAGDLNAPPDSKAIRLLRCRFGRTCVDIYPSDNPKTRIDYIMFKP